MRGYTVIGPLAYRGKDGCESAVCARMGAGSGPCYGWHCSYCDEPCSSQGHPCDASETYLAEARRAALKKGAVDE